MCFDAKTSFTTGTLTIITSLILMRYGNPAHRISNQQVGYLFIYIALVQYLEGFMWLDQSCRLDLNRITTCLMPYIIYLQPTLVYLLGHDRTPMTNLVNLLYVGLVFLVVTTTKLGKCSVPNLLGHLNWNQVLSEKTLLVIPYLLLLNFNLWSGISAPISKYLILMLNLSLLISYLFFQYNTGEMWCYLSCCLPLILYFITRKRSTVPLDLSPRRSNGDPIGPVN